MNANRSRIINNEIKTNAELHALTDTKKCNKCHKILPYTEYDLSTRRDGTKFIRGQCKTCSLKSRYKNENTKGQHLRKYWPETTGQQAYNNYMNLLIKQENRCKICNNPETKIMNRKQAVSDLAVDHCHQTGKVRGLLCDNCNKAIGFIKDSPELCILMANYLKNT